MMRKSAHSIAAVFLYLLLPLFWVKSALLAPLDVEHTLAMYWPSSIQVIVTLPTNGLANTMNLYYHCVRDHPYTFTW